MARAPQHKGPGQPEGLGLGPLHSPPSLTNFQINITNHSCQK